VVVEGGRGVEAMFSNAKRRFGFVVMVGRGRFEVDMLMILDRCG
jgi:hypothetical protein